MLWRPLPRYQDLSHAEQADCRASFRLILERCDPNLRAGESGQTMLHEVIARDHSVGVSLGPCVELVTLLLARGADPIEPRAEPWAKPLAWADVT